MAKLDYTIPDSPTMLDAAEKAQTLRSLGEVYKNSDALPLAAAAIDALIAELREWRQAHAEVVEDYHALRKRVRDAIDNDDFA